MSEVTIQELVRIHDDEPQTVAAALRTLARQGTVQEKDQGQFAWLVNHVIGEKEGRWGEALELQRAAFPGAASVAPLLQRAAAALLAGEPVEAWAIQSRIAELHGATADVARAAVQLRATQYVAARAPAADLALSLRDCVRSLAAEAQAGAMAAALASSLNNGVSALLDRQDASPDAAVVREALVEGAQAARRLWHEAGNWVNHERADYLVALCCNRVGDWSQARQAAEAGLATIQANGSEDVDRAFLLLEVARASRGLGDEARREAARGEAMALAQGFDAGLREWFDGRAQAA